MKRTKIILYIFSTATVLLLAVLIYGVINIRAENQNISEVSNQADSAGNESAVAGSIRSIKNSYATNIQKLESFVLTTGELVPFIETLEKTGKDFGLNTKITSVGSDKNTDTSSPSQVSIALETDGSWSSSMNFIKSLENLPTKVNLNSISMNAGEDQTTGAINVSNKSTMPTKNTWHTTANITVYIFK